MKTNASSTSKFPVEIKRGNVAVKIYRGKNRVNGTSYDQYTLVYYDGAQRKKKRFADLEEARREAEFSANKLANGENEVLRLTPSDRAIYVQSVEALRPFGVPLNVAVLEYVSAIKGLPEGATLKEAVDYFRKRNPASLVKRTVREVVDEMIAAKRAAKLSDVHIKDLESRLGKFANDFQLNVGGVSGQMLQAWLDGMDASGRTRRGALPSRSTLRCMVVTPTITRSTPKLRIAQLRSSSGSLKHSWECWRAVAVRLPRSWKTK